MTVFQTKANEAELAITPEEDKFFMEVYKDFLDDRTILLSGYVDERLFEKATLQVLKFNKDDIGKDIEKRKPIKIHINTDGGDVSSGLRLIDAIQASKTPVIGICHCACSMGAFILVVCHKRVAFRNATILFHDGTTFIGSSASKVKDTIKWLDELESRLDSLVLDNTNIEKEVYETHRRDEWYMFPNIAKELGVISGIVGEDVELDEIL